MKTLRLVSLITLVFTFLTVVRCSDSKTTTVTLGTLSGAVKYTNAAGTSVAAPAAFVTLLSGASTVIQVVADNAGQYSIANLPSGSYTMSSSFYAEPTNTGGRLNGLTFATETDVAVTMGSSNLTQDLTLVNKGQSGADLDAADVNYDWNGTAYANTGALTYDNTHSPVGFEFAYRGKEADFFGGFSQLKKCRIAFDVTNPTAGTIDVVVDLASFDTRSPGGRDPRTTVADTPPWDPNTQFTEYGCIVNSTFGLVTDSGTAPSDATPQVITGSTRYASFTSTSIAKLGDGFVAKGNLVFHGNSVPIEMWFKQVPCWTNTSVTPNRRYWSFEGKFLMDAKNKWAVVNSSLNDAIVRMQISIIAYKNL